MLLTKNPLSSPSRALWLAIAFITLLFFTHQALVQSDYNEVKSEPFNVRPSSSDPDTPPELNPNKPAGPSPEEQKAKELEKTNANANKAVWEQLKKVLREAKPENGPVQLTESLDPFAGVPKNVDDVPDVVNMTSSDISLMKKAHTTFINKITEQNLQLHYKVGTKGIVTTAAEKDLGSVVMSLRMLRRTGCNLPVEVLVSTDEVAASPMCKQVLSVMNTKCISTSASIGTDNPELDDNRYLNKLFALIFSSFDDNLFLDADNLPIFDPGQYFDAEPYISRGLVAWPDFWPSSISKKHAEITSTTLPPVNGTVESGQLLISKTLHTKTLLLSFYYNFYGPKYYYPLESQGAVGFGDKESFLNAALALNASYYLVQSPIIALGYWDQGSFHGPAMAQFDLLQDYRNTISKLATSDELYVKPKIVFVHHNMLKLVPDNVFGSQGHAEYTRLKSNGKFTRLWGPKEDTEEKFQGEDMEKTMWETLKTLTCELKDRGLLGKGNKSDNCQKCREYMKSVFGSDDRKEE